MLRMAERLPQDWEIDYEDLGNVFGRARIQSCNACVSTAMSLCVWPCKPQDQRETYAPLVWQCRFRGIDVPDALWRWQSFGCWALRRPDRQRALVTGCSVSTSPASFEWLASDRRVARRHSMYPMSDAEDG